MRARSVALRVTGFILKQFEHLAMGTPGGRYAALPRKLCSRQESTYILRGFSDLKAQIQYGYAAKTRKSSAGVRSRGHA